MIDEKARQDDSGMRELSASEIEMVAGAGCRTEMRVRCNTNGVCYAEAVLICDL